MKNNLFLLLFCFFFIIPFNVNGATFGYTTAGTNSVNISLNLSGTYYSYRYGNISSTTNNGILTKATVNLAWSSGGNTNENVFINRDSDKIQIASSEIIDLNLTNSKTWYDFNLNNENILSGVDYIINILGDGTKSGNPAPGLSMDTVTGYKYYIEACIGSSGYTNCKENPYNPTSNTGFKFSIYATYTASPSSSRPTSTYDANRPTSTVKVYKGASWVLAYNTSTGMWTDASNNATSNPFPVNRAQWGSGANFGVEFTSTEYGLITSTNSVYATTTPSTTAGLGIPFKANINEFEVYATETPAMAKNYIPYWIGRSNNITSTNASATNAMDDRLFMLNFCSNKWIEIDNNLNGSGTSTGSILTTTTFPWSITNKICYARPTTTSLGNRWQSNYAIFSPDIWTDCYNQASTSAKLLCYKMNETTTGPEGDLSGVGCGFQTSDEDIFNQCNTAPNNDVLGCFTDTCGAGTQTGKCGYYTDNAQHNCNICHGCPVSDEGSSACEAKSTGYYDQSEKWGCGGVGAPCFSCADGSCTSAQCEGLMCGCDAGEICVSGTCTPENPPTCAQVCSGLGYNRGGCYIPFICTLIGKYSDGPSTDCTSPRACCCWN